MRPVVDVGVVTWNSAELTVRALRRLLDTDQGCELRVLVHDNGSSDHTVDALAEHVPEAEVEACPANLGFAAGMNRVLARSRAPWFFALNSDAWPEPGAIGALLAAAQRNARAAAVAPLLLRPDGSVEHSTHPFPSVAVALLDAVGGRRWLPKRVLERLCLEGAWHHDRPRAVDWAVGAALLLRRDALAELGAFDERFFMYVEDLDWCWRARRAGWEVRFEPSAVVRHVGNASGERRWGETRTALEAANLRVLQESTLGPSKARAYRLLEAVACSERLALARIRGRRRAADADYWRRQLKVHLGFGDPPPPGALDGLGAAPSASPEVLATPGDGGPRPDVAVVVPTHGRADLLARLVAALEAQTLSRESFEVVVVDDGSPDETADVLDKLAAESTLRLTLLHLPVRKGPAAARNAGWHATGAPAVAFTDDDCVPDPGWLRAGLDALGGAPRVVVGRTEPPDDQLALVREPFARFVEAHSARFFETCNVFYRRRDLVAVGGFDERFRRPSGEDTHLGLAVAALGVVPVFAEDARVAHDVRSGNLRAALRETLRWVDLPLVVRGRPRARRDLLHRWVFWRSTHPPAIAAVAGILLGTRWRPALALVLWWAHHRLRTTPVCADPVRRVTTLPGALALDVCEVAVMARGSLRHRTVLL